MGVTQLAHGVVALTVLLGGIYLPAGDDTVQKAGAQRPLAGLSAQLGRTDGGTAAPATAGGSAAQTAAEPSSGGSEVLADISDPNRFVNDPEDTTITSVAFSPSFERDRTAFAIGMTRCFPSCPLVLFRSVDAGRSWTRLPAAGLFADKLLLPSGFGAGEDRIFAMGNIPTQVGLQVSENGGTTFHHVAAVAPLFTGSAAISPAFNDGDPTILIGAQNATEYDDTTATLRPAPFDALPGPLEPAFAPDYPADPRILFGGVRIDSSSSTLQTPVVRVCTRPTVTSGGESGSPLCTETRLPVRGDIPKLRPSPSFATDGVLYALTSDSLLRSEDGGSSFSVVEAPAGSLMDVEFSPDSEVLLGATFEPDGRLGHGIHRSLDGGRTWTAASGPGLEQGAFDLAWSGERILAALRSGLACSSDQGRTWSPRC